GGAVSGPVGTARRPAPSAYYVRFVDGNGNVLTGDGGAQWFQLSDFSVGFSNSASFGATGGAGAGRGTFNPLSLQLPSNELPRLDKLLFTGSHLSQIEGAGDATAGDTQMLVDDYLFGKGFLTAAAAQHSGAQQLSVIFGQVVQTHYSQSSTGAVQPPTQIGWDQVTNSADPAGGAAPLTGPVATASSPAPSAYYVRFVDGNGNVLTGDGGAQWVQLSGFSVGFSNSASFGATGGAGAGRATFNPLSLQLPSNELPRLDNLLFTGSHLSPIEVAGDATAGDTQTLGDGDLFGTDFLAAASTNISGAQQLSVIFGQVVQTHYSQSSTGAVQPPTQIGWDQVTNSADPAGGAAPLTGPVATASSPAPSAYYVRFVDGNGNVLTGDGGPEWFQLSDFSVGCSNSASFGATGGAGAGRATFNPLSLQLPSNELPRLDNLLFTGSHLSQIEVAGYATAGDTQTLVDDYLFGTDFLTAASTNISGAQQLSVIFGQVVQTHYSQSSTGAVQPPTQIGWDQVTNSADPAGGAAPLTGPVATASSPAPSAYYVRFVDGNGNVLTGDGGAQWFQLSDFSVGFSNSASFGATGGAGAG